MKKLLFVLLLSVLFASCGKDENPANNSNPINPLGWTEIYNSNGFFDSLTCKSNYTFCGTYTKLIGNFDLTVSDSVKCQFDYILSGGLHYFKIYMEQPVGTPHYVLNCTSLPAVNSYTAYTVTIPSHKLKHNHYYEIEILKNSHFEVRNLIILKK